MSPKPLPPIALTSSNIQRPDQAKLTAEKERKAEVHFQTLRIVTSAKSLAPSTLTSSTVDHSSQPTLVSLHVCRECQKMLLAAFWHCLGSNSGVISPNSLGGVTSADSTSLIAEPVLQSVHEIDEVADAVRLTSPPYFAVVEDPTEQENTIFSGITDKVQKDRAVFAKDKLERHKQNVAHNPQVMAAYHADKSTIVAPVYQRKVSSQNQQIMELRERIRQKGYIEKLKHDYVATLRQALQKSMQYYAYAEEWQEYESSRLQLDVRYLKAELASLMAFVINSEDERRKLTLYIDDLKSLVLERDTRVAELEQVCADIKAKLHESFKDFLSNNEVLVKMRQDAMRGSELVQSRNQILQRNLDKLARDFEVSSKELSTSHVRIKELEYALEDLVEKFNACGEAKRNLEEDNVKLISDLARVKNDVKQTEIDHAYSLERAAKLEAQIKELGRAQLENKHELECKILDLRSNVEMVKAVKTDLEISLKQYKAENEKLSSAIKSLTRAKEQLESALRVTTQKAEKELSTRDSKIKELEILQAADLDKLVVLSQQKERILVQIEDLEAALDVQMNNLSSVQVDLQQIRKTSEEQSLHLQQEIDKNAISKGNLANDKKQLVDKLKMVQSDLKAKERQYVALEAKFKRNREEANELIEAHQNELSCLKNRYEDLIAENNKLQVEHHEVIDQNVNLKVAQNAMLKKHAEFEKQDAEIVATIAEIQKAIDELDYEYGQMLIEREGMKSKISNVLQRVAELTSQIAIIESEGAARSKEKDTEIVQLTAELYQLRESVSQLDQQARLLRDATKNLKADLDDTCAALAKETSEREQIENQIYDTRRALVAEHTTRREFERMHGRLALMDDVRQRQANAVLQMRNRVLSGAGLDLSEHLKRLQSFTDILPLDDPLVWDTRSGPDAAAFNVKR